MRRRLVIDQPIRRGSERTKKRKAPAEPEVAPKEKAKELVDRGMPYQMAMAVVHGRMELNEALERLSRRDQVNVLMERHELSRALRVLDAQRRALERRGESGRRPQPAARPGLCQRQPQPAGGERCHVQL